MIEQTIKKVFAKLLDNECSHLKDPSTVYGKVTSASALSADSWSYGIKLLGSDFSLDSQKQEVPNVRSKVELEVGATVALLRMPDKAVFIAGEVLL